MSYAYRSQDLFSLLQTKAPATGATLAENFRRNEYGLLSVGLKIHCLDNGENFKELIEGLGGASRILEVNYFKDARASLCLVLPPVGSAFGKKPPLAPTGTITAFLTCCAFTRPRTSVR